MRARSESCLWKNKGGRVLHARYQMMEKPWGTHQQLEDPARVESPLQAPVRNQAQNQQPLTSLKIFPLF